MFAGGGGGGKPKNDPYVKRLQHGEQVAKKGHQITNYFFPRGGGVEGRKLTLPPPPPMRAPMSILYIFLKRMFSENVLQDAPN